MIESGNNSAVAEKTICPKCGAEFDEGAVCPNCSGEAAAQEPEDEQRPAESVDSASAEEFAAEPKKKGKKKLVIALAAVAVVVAAVVAALVFLLPTKSDDEPVKRTLYAKDNSLYYLEPDTNTPVLITDDLFVNEDDYSYFITTGLAQFTKNGNKVFYAKKIIGGNDLSFSLYYRFLNKPDEEPVKLAEDVVGFIVDEKGDNVLYLDSFGSIYNHDMAEREKVVSDVEYFEISKDCTKLLYRTEDGGLYIQGVDGEKQKEKIDSDVTSLEKTGDNFEFIYYCKDKDLYLKKADTDKLKIDSDIFSVELVCDNGGVYYTKENEDKGTGTLMDYVIDGIEEDDERILGNYFADPDTYNEALYRYWSREVLKKTTVKTVESLYYFNGETSDLVNASFVEELEKSDKANTLIFRSYDSLNIKKVGITDFVNALDNENHFRAKAGSTYKTDFQEYNYFDEFADMIYGTLRSEATAYIVQNGKAIKMETDGVSDNFVINDAGDTVYYLDKYNVDKKSGELRAVKIKDGAVESNELYDSEVNRVEIIAGNNVLYWKDKKDNSGDLYLNKQLIEYDVNDAFFVDEDKNIVYYTEYDANDRTGTLNIYSNGEKRKIADDVSYAASLGNGDILYYRNYSVKANKSDLYVNRNGEEIKIDFDVRRIFETTDESEFRCVLNLKDLIDLGELEWTFGEPEWSTAD